jgi:pimeloyl-ACP methyl ester carboxylesterase
MLGAALSFALGDEPATRDTASATRPATNRPTTRSTQFGCERLDFQVDGHRAFIIRPARPAADGARPWVWYAPTFTNLYPSPRHKWLMTRLLDRGFAIAGIDVGESYGNPKGRAAYQSLHDVLTREFGLSRKASLLPQSRGGLMLYNWAAEHPDLVACIGGIYTVCDLTSYPGPDRAAPAYDMSPDELRAHLAEHNPIDRLKPLADAKVPIFHIHGDADRIVPMERNSGELIRRYVALGGSGELLVVPGKGHEEIDAFFQSQSLLDFFLSHSR